MDIPSVDPVGVVQTPSSYQGNGRKPVWLRVAAAALLGIFLAVVVTTTVVSVGHYCLTSDGGDTRGLPSQSG